MNHSCKILLGFLTLICLTEQLSAESLDVLPDGRNVIQIFRERIAFDVKDAKNVEFGRVHDGSLLTLPLEKAIVDVEDAQAFFQGFRLSHIGIFVRIHLIQQIPDRDLLGKFHWKDYPRTNPTRPLSFSILPTNEPQKGFKDGKFVEYRPHSRPPLPPFQYFPDASRVTENGFTEYPDKKPPSIKSGVSTETIYVLPGSKRQSPTETDLRVTCTRAGGPSRNCGFVMLSSDGLVSLNLGWNENAFPESRWKKLDDDIRKLAGSIFIDRKLGDFE